MAHWVLFVGQAVKTFRILDQPEDTEVDWVPEDTEVDWVPEMFLVLLSTLVRGRCPEAEPQMADLAVRSILDELGWLPVKSLCRS
jgi:hypothetical protein